MSFEILTSSLVSALIGAVTGIMTVFATMRKDDISVVVENITKERKEWRSYLRNWIGEVSKIALTKEWTLENYLFYRSQLASRLNPFDEYDKSILNEFDNLRPIQNKEEISFENFNILIELQKKLIILLKQDWERVKLDCTPWYRKVYFRMTHKKKKTK